MSLLLAKWKSKEGQTGFEQKGRSACQIEATPPSVAQSPPKPKQNTGCVRLNNSTLIKKTLGYTTTFSAAEPSLADRHTELHSLLCVKTFFSMMTL